VQECGALPGRACLSLRRGFRYHTRSYAKHPHASRLVYDRERKVDRRECTRDPELVEHFKDMVALGAVDTYLRLCHEPGCIFSCGAPVVRL